MIKKVSAKCMPLIRCLIVILLTFSTIVWEVVAAQPTAPGNRAPEQSEHSPFRLNTVVVNDMLVGTFSISTRAIATAASGQIQARLFDASGQQLAILPMEVLSPGEFQFLIPLRDLIAPLYLEIDSPDIEAKELHPVYRIDPDGPTITRINKLPTARDITDPQGIHATGGPDAYGYSWNDAAGYSWVNLTAPNTVPLRADDDYYGPVGLGFTFRFYGEDYTQLYIDSNGFLSFSNNGRSYYNRGKDSLPETNNPNNVIAPFWEDFNPYYGGEILYQMMGSAPRRYFVVEWRNVPLYDATEDTQSVQVVLYEGNNEILFQYPNTRRGQRGDLSEATVGVENADGTVGLIYPYTIPIDENRAIMFSYTLADYNVSLSPSNQGGTAAAGSTAAFRVRIKNMGANSDAFTLSRSSYQGSNWPAMFYDSDGITPLKSDSTGYIASEQQKDIVVRVSVPTNATAGDWTRAIVRATSQSDGAVQAEVVVDTMLTPSFYYTYVDDESGDGTTDAENYVAPIVEGANRTRRLTTDLDDSNYAGITGMSGGNAVVSWNTSYWNYNWYSVNDIQYAVVDNNSNFIQAITRLTDNSNATHNISEYSPAVAIASNGNIIFGWSRQEDVDNDGYKELKNIWYAIVDRSGTFVKTPTALTNNTDDTTRDYPPAVAAFNNENFLLAWQHGTGGVPEIYYVVLNHNGDVLRGPLAIPDSEIWNSYPRAAPLPDGNAVVVWSYKNEYGIYEIYYVVLSATGKILSEPLPVTENEDSGIESNISDVGALSDGRLAIAWSQGSYSTGYPQIQYTIFLPLGVPNGDFERGAVEWAEYSSNGWDLIVTDFPGNLPLHSGNWAVWLGGDDNETSRIQQQITVPAIRPYLSYWHWIASEDDCSYDYGYVAVNGATVDSYDLCEEMKTDEWVQHTVDLRAYAGQTVALEIRAETDSSLNSNLFIDDVTFQAGAATAYDTTILPNLREISPKQIPAGAGNAPALNAVPKSQKSYEYSMPQAMNAISNVIHTINNELCTDNRYVSLAVDAEDYLIITWLDYTEGYGNAPYLFYALADSAGSLLTPATVLQRTRHSYLWTSWNGYGNAPMFTGWSTYLPVILKAPPPTATPTTTPTGTPPPTATPTATPLPTNTPTPLVINSGFEFGNFTGWNVGSNTTDPARPAPLPQIVGVPHGGGYAAVLGQENAPCEWENGVSGKILESWIYQDIRVPGEGTPQLTLYYRILTYDKFRPGADEPFDHFAIWIDSTQLHQDGNTTDNCTCSHPINDLGWREYRRDLSAYKGQTIRLRLVNVTRPDKSYPTWTYVDDISVSR